MSKYVTTIEIKKMFSIVHRNVVGTMPELESNTIICVLDTATGKEHYALWRGGVFAMDYLPGGILYLGDTIEEVYQSLGVERSLV